MQRAHLQPPVRERSGGRHALTEVVCESKQFGASTTSTEAERFFRKPNFQLRDVGASAPDTSFSQKPSLPAWRQP